MSGSVKLVAITELCPLQWVMTSLNNRKAETSGFKFLRMPRDRGLPRLKKNIVLELPGN
jgi:hypothetical protein